MRGQSVGTVALIMLVFGLVDSLLAAGYQALLLKRDAAFKRRWYPWDLAFLSVFILSSIVLLTSIEPAFRIGGLSPRQHLILFSPLLLIPALGFRKAGTRFCDSCGATVILMNWRNYRYCCECGTRLEKSPRARSFWSMSPRHLYPKHWICPACGLGIPSGIRSGRMPRLIRYRYCLECGAKLAVGPKAAGKKGGHDDILAP